MSELSPDARDLIAQARKQRLGPSPKQRAELREKLAPLWAAEAPRPSAFGRWRWKIGSVALFAGLGWMLMQAAGAPSVTERCPHGTSLRAGECVPEAPAATDSVAASAQPLPERCTDGSLRAGECVPEALASTGSAAESVGVLPERCPHGSLRAGECTPEPPATTGSAVASIGALPARCPRGSLRTGECAPEATTGRVAASPQPHPELCAGECVPEADSVVASAQQLAAAAPRRAKREGPVTRKPAARGRDVSRPDERKGPRLAEDQSALLPPGAAETRASTSAQQRVPRGAANERPQPVHLPVRAGERTPARAVQTEADPGPPSIEGELELLGAAQAALQKQRPSRALTLLQEHAFRFPSGAMVEERMAMQALALCALQRRHAAQTVLANMEARGSQSQLLPRVRSQCGL